MRVHVSVIFALLSSPVVASNDPFAAIGGVQEALLELPSLFSTVTRSSHIETNDLNTWEQPSLHRELQQFTDACNASYYELWSDQALNEAYAVYSNGTDAALLSIGDSNVDACVQDDAGDLTCDFNQPIDGETEFTSACTTAGGKTFPYTLDLSCDATLDGNTTNLVLDLPTMLECIPASPDFDSCADALREGIQNATELYASIVEGAFTVGGFMDVSCAVVDAGGENGGGDSGGSDNGESDNGGSDNGGESKASSFGVLFSFGVVTILSLTFG